jgi:flagellar biogenesis protein FliO
MMETILKMMLFMGSLALVLFFCARMFKRLNTVKGNSLSGAGIKILTSKLIAPQKYISLIEIAGEVLALGITPQQVTFLTKIENRELLKGNLPASSTRAESLSGFRFWFPRLKRMKGGLF